jgi:hypothetical protein
MAAISQSPTEACAELRKLLNELGEEHCIAARALEVAIKALELYADPAMWADGEGRFLYRYDAGNIARKTIKEIVERLK